MTNRLFPSKNRHLKVIFKRVGREVTITRPDGNASANQYGKISDEDVSYSTVETAYARRMYGSFEERPNEAGVMGGRIDTDTPRVAFPEDADVQEDDRVEFPDGKVYAVDEEVPRATHNEFRVTLITG